MKPQKVHIALRECVCSTLNPKALDKMCGCTSLGIIRIIGCLQPLCKGHELGFDSQPPDLAGSRRILGRFEHDVSARHELDARRTLQLLDR